MRVASRPVPPPLELLELELLVLEPALAVLPERPEVRPLDPVEPLRDPLDPPDPLV